MSEMKHSRDILNARLLERIESLAAYLFPEGKKVGHSWRLGSLDINLRTGMWGDWDGTTESMSRNLVDLWIHATHVDFKTAISEITRWLGIPETASHPSSQGRITRSCEPEQEKRLVLPHLNKPRRSELHELSARRLIPIEALEIAVNRGFLWAYTDHYEKVRAWLLTDSARKSAVGRRLDGQPWQAPWAKGAKSKSLKGSWGHWPIGIREARNFSAIGLVEGTPDFLALIAHALVFGGAERVAPVCMAGAQMSIPESALALFIGKRVRIFIHDDDAGKKAASRWWKQLRNIATIDTYTFDGLVQTDGRPVTDLNDMCNLDPGSREGYRKEVDELMDFLTEGPD